MIAFSLTGNKKKHVLSFIVDRDITWYHPYEAPFGNIYQNGKYCTLDKVMPLAGIRPTLYLLFYYTSIFYTFIFQTSITILLFSTSFCHYILNVALTTEVYFPLLRICLLTRKFNPFILTIIFYIFGLIFHIFFSPYCPRDQVTTW